MSSFKKINSQFEILEYEDKKTFTITKEEQKITFYDDKVIEDVISKKFNEKYKQILSIIMDLNDSDDSTESDMFLVRDRISELRNILMNKYGNYISRQLLNKYLKMLMILEDKIIISEKVRGR